MSDEDLRPENWEIVPPVSSEPQAADAANANLLDLQKAGATSRALGSSFLDNPFLHAENLPAATGATAEVWSAKHDAWHLGWTTEDLILGR